MDNKEFEKKLEQIKTFKEIPVSVDKKIQKAFEKIEENEKSEKEVKKQKSKFKFRSALSLAASFVMVLFLAGNGVAYAKGETNIYSWILEKIGIQKEYEEIKTEVNQSAESNGLKITLVDAGYDTNRLVLGYKIEDANYQIRKINNKYQSKLDNDIEASIYDAMFFDGDYKFYTDKHQVVTNPQQNNMGNSEDIISKQISEKEYIIYQTIPISEVEWEGKITNIDIQLKALSFLGVDEIIEGKWIFKIDELNNKYSEDSFYTLDINKKIDNQLTIKTIRVNNSGVFGTLELNYETKVENIDNYYLFQVMNKENKKIGEFSLATGMSTIPITYQYISHLNENEEYKILIYNNDNYDDIEAGKVNPIDIISFVFKNQ